MERGSGSGSCPFLVAGPGEGQGAGDTREDRLEVGRAEGEFTDLPARPPLALRT